MGSRMTLSRRSSPDLNFIFREYVKRTPNLGDVLNGEIRRFIVGRGLAPAANPISNRSTHNWMLRLIVRHIGIDYITGTIFFQYSGAKAFGGSKLPRPTYAWQAEHPAVHRARLTGQVSQSHKYTETGTPLGASRFYAVHFLSIDTKRARRYKGAAK